MSDGLKESVRGYWEAKPCGSTHTSAPPGSKAFYDEIEQSRYRLEPFIPAFAEFERWTNRSVLEVGVGLGTDFIQFARAGAKLSGIDLTDQSVELVRRRLELEGLESDLRVGDAEQLPFPAESFDLVYSWGVLHHTPNTQRALGEIRRVLRPGGEARVMLYSRRSWVAFGLWAWYALARGRPWRSLGSVISEHMESPGTKAYTQGEIEELFADFRNLAIRRFLTPYDRRVAGPIIALGGTRLGWFTGIIAEK